MFNGEGIKVSGERSVGRERRGILLTKMIGENKNNNNNDNDDDDDDNGNDDDENDDEELLR